MQLDLPLDVSLDREVLAAVQLALDDDRLADIHDVPLDHCCRRGSGCAGALACRAAVRVRPGSPGWPAPVGFTASSRFHIWSSALLAAASGRPKEPVTELVLASRWREPTEYIGRVENFV